MMRATRRNEKILVFVSRFTIKICFYEAILDYNHDIKE